MEANIRIKEENKILLYILKFKNSILKIVLNNSFL